MILKEFRCKKCLRDFESLLPICESCGGEATRVFLTPPQINTKRLAPKTDRILQYQFDRLGITNFTNRDGMSRPEFKQIGSTASTVHGAPQQPIQATYSPSFLAQNYGVNTGGLTVNGSPYQLPDPSKIHTAPLAPGQRVGSFPQEMRDRTQIVGRTDDRGNVIEINGSNGR